MKLIFVCTGNTCRSPMAEGLLRELLKTKGRTDVTCASCGLGAFSGDCASENAILAAKELGADIRQHRSAQANQYLLEEADLILCMTQAHADAVSRLLPEKRTLVLGEGIPDPYGSDLECYRGCAAAIRDALEQLYATYLEKD